ncbi:hypothetical protein [Paraburkholderia sp. J10-1]|uniref:hypothetical protein n=1 Tax=Paraburkholderia sp. J10-1 TaxID=2805430 RepID=UPI002AB65097|nr:hypothetical protein [Paraburkholderia sp. J10-1]
MDYFKEAFGGFDPRGDEDAALKFALDVIFADHRIQDLTRVVSLEQGVGGLEGEPGWIVEHRGRTDIVGYEMWPRNSRFRSFVDPESYSLVCPEFYCDEKTFRRYVEAISEVYVARNPERRRDVDSLLIALSSL